MTVPASVVMGAGLQGVHIYEIDPATAKVKEGTMAAPYSGLHVQGARVINVTDPEPRRITHVGDNRALGLTVLPATEFVSGELRTGKRNRIIDEVLSGINEITVGEAKFFGVGTDRRGFESQVCLIGYSNSQDADEDSANAGEALWDSLVIPKARLLVREGNKDDNALEMAYTINPYPVTRYPWGVQFDMANEGYKQAAALTATSIGVLRLITAVGNAIATAITFPSDIEAVATSKISVFVNDVLVTSGITKAVSSVTWTTAPATSDHIMIAVESL
jgi:hypothetical protein